MNTALRFSLVRLLTLGIALPFCPGPAYAQAQADAGIAAPADVAPEQPSSSVEEAGQRYDRGLKLYAEGEYPLAVIEFERAYELVPDYRVLYNIGQVRIQLANYARAHRALTQYLKEGGERVPAERRTSVEADLEMLASRTGTLRVDINVPGAEIFVNDLVVGRSPLPEALLLDAGEHRLSARKAGYQPRASQVTLAGRDALSVRLELEKIPDGPSSIIVQQRVAEDSDRPAWIWGTWSATGALAVGAAVTGALGIKAANDLEAQRDEINTNKNALESQSRRATTLLRTADVLGGLAILTGGVALYLTLSSPSAEESDAPSKDPAQPPAPQVGLALRPGWLGVSGTY